MNATVDPQGCYGEENAATYATKADARIRTADPFITSYARLHPGFGYFRRMLGSEEVGFSVQLRRTPPRSRDVFQRCSNRPTSV